MSFGSRKETVKSLTESKDFREAYLWAYLKRMVPFQIRSMRTERDWSQAKAGEILGKPQNVVSRLESPAYGKLSIQTLLEVAKGFDVGLLIKFVPYSRLLKEYEDVSLEALQAASPTSDFPAELDALDEWSKESDEEFWEAGEDDPLPLSSSTKLAVVGGNPKKATEQRVLPIAELKLVATNNSVQPLNNAKLLSGDSSIKNISVAR